MLKKALTINETAFGPDHPNVAFYLNNLALLRVAQARYADSEPLYQRALALRESKLAPGHPDLATSLENYAALLRKTDRNSAAAAMEARANAIRGKQANDSTAN